MGLFRHDESVSIDQRLLDVHRDLDELWWDDRIPAGELKQEIAKLQMMLLAEWERRR